MMVDGYREYRGDECSVAFFDGDVGYMELSGQDAGGMTLAFSSPSQGRPIVGDDFTTRFKPPVASWALALNTLYYDSRARALRGAMDDLAQAELVAAHVSTPWGDYVGNVKHAGVAIPQNDDAIVQVSAQLAGDGPCAGAPTAQVKSVTIAANTAVAAAGVVIAALPAATDYDRARGVWMVVTMGDAATDTTLKLGEAGAAPEESAAVPLKPGVYRVNKVPENFDRWRISAVAPATATQIKFIFGSLMGAVGVAPVTYTGPAATGTLAATVPFRGSDAQVIIDNIDLSTEASGLRNYAANVTHPTRDRRVHHGHRQTGLTGVKDVAGTGRWDVTTLSAASFAFKTGKQVSVVDNEEGAGTGKATRRFNAWTEVTINMPGGDACSFNVTHSGNGDIIEGALA